LAYVQEYQTPFNFDPPAVERVSAAAQELLNSLVTTAPPRDRETEAECAKARSAQRFGAN
jgi:hypothetical protein